MNGETRCTRCGEICQCYKGPDGQIYCWNIAWGTYPTGN